jgi:hypothetical protein
VKLKSGASLWQTLKRPPWRTVVPASTVLLLVLAARALWSPGLDVTDGRHDLKLNGLWLQHGWLGHDSWFTENDRTDRKPRFRSAAKIRELVGQMRQRHFTDVFPHLCPTDSTGAILPVDDHQTELFLNEFQGIRVLPWIGGVLDADVTPELPARRRIFVKSISDLLKKHPRLSGVHLNVEPWPSGNKSMLTFLDEIRRVIPKGKLLSVAAYPPPTRWHPFPEVHWEEAYFKQVAGRVDQMVVMMYDTSLKDGKLYQHLMNSWTRQILNWTTATGKAKVPAILLGVPTYDDAGVGYHNPKVENLTNALQGIHAGLSHYQTLPPHYQGVAVYSEWVTSDSDWNYWQQHFVKP